jgi:hypothetical protein
MILVFVAGSLSLIQVPYTASQLVPRNENLSSFYGQHSGILSSVMT